MVEKIPKDIIYQGLEYYRSIGQRRDGLIVRDDKESWEAVRGGELLVFFLWHSQRQLSNLVIREIRESKLSRSLFSANSSINLSLSPLRNTPWRVSWSNLESAGRVLNSTEYPGESLVNAFHVRWVQNTLWWTGEGGKQVRKAWLGMEPKPLWWEQGRV